MEGGRRALWASRQRPCGGTRGTRGRAVWDGREEAEHCQVRAKHDLAWRQHIRVGALRIVEHGADAGGLAEVQHEVIQLQQRLVAGRSCARAGRTAGRSCKRTQIRRTRDHEALMGMAAMPSMAHLVVERAQVHRRRERDMLHAVHAQEFDARRVLPGKQRVHHSPGEVVRIA